MPECAAFAELLERLAFTPARNGKLRLLTDYLREAPDPDRGWGIAAITRDLTLDAVKPAMLRAAATARVDPELFALSYDFVGDLAETIALIWPAPDAPPADPPLAEVVDTLRATSRREAPQIVERLLDRLDASGRFALLKLVTGGLRVGVSARLAKQALADLGARDVTEIEELWHGLAPPYVPLFAWLAGTGPRPEPSRHHALPPGHALPRPRRGRPRPPRPRRLRRRMEMGRHPRPGRRRRPRPPPLLPHRRRHRRRLPRPPRRPRLRRRPRRRAARPPRRRRASPPSPTCSSASTARPSPPPSSAATPRTSAPTTSSSSAPATSARSPSPNAAPPSKPSSRRLDPTRVDLSPLLPFATWDDLAALRAAPPDPIIEGVMLKRRDSPYVAGRPKGPWWKWKRDPHTIDAVLLYAQRGHGKRSGYYSDYTFGVWTPDGTLTPVGKAYFGFTDEELAADRPLGPQQHHRPLRPGPRRPRRARPRPRPRGRLRGPRPLHPPPLRPRHALPPHRPPPLGQAPVRGRHPGDAGGAAPAVRRTRSTRLRNGRLQAERRTLPRSSTRLDNFNHQSDDRSCSIPPVAVPHLNQRIARNKLLPHRQPPVPRQLLAIAGYLAQSTSQRLSRAAALTWRRPGLVDLLQPRSAALRSL